MPSVLFVCTANQFRSPIAALCFTRVVQKEDEAETWDIGSAGTWTKTGLHAPPVAIKVAALLGLQGLESHISRQIDQDLVSQYDLIVVMENNHKEAILSEFPNVAGRLFLLSELATGISYDIPDPAYPGINPEDIGRELKNLIIRAKEKILELSGHTQGG